MTPVRAIAATAATAALALTAAAATLAQPARADWTTYHADPARTGVDASSGASVPRAARAGRLQRQDRRRAVPARRRPVRRHAREPAPAHRAGARRRTRADRLRRQRRRLRQLLGLSRLGPGERPRSVIAVEGADLE